MKIAKWFVAALLIPHMAVANDFSYEIRTATPVVSTEMPVILEVIITNTTDHDLRAPPPVNWDCNVPPPVKDHTGAMPQLTPTGKGIELEPDGEYGVMECSGPTPRAKILKPGESTRDFAVVNFWYVLSPGLYTIAQFMNAPPTAKPITVEVKQAAKGDVNADGIVDEEDAAALKFAADLGITQETLNGR